ncbi:carboxypeptidase-like regulatory domain-containing protein [Mucilaginibacter robiniae]|uniref:Carboxypeptidase-like regulatory domain-containing protein n=1 Tax=Mucilaginibacter robiniae TaxID=2728022 RepID=A0A7L5E5T9_9SPHI|nr:DUF5686 and carboxypeptidase regulatory-like domain-containing protein [Mucilaginibacter robiniae]QJD97134.1 carboxypeptidase-like regulatory domain-containing protein [Mucilaginibacter robiniae]
MKVTLLAFCFIFITAITWAQTTTLSGTIKDDGGHPVAFATVLVNHSTLGTSANSEGEYTLNLASGSYEILFKAIGYRQESRKITVTNSKQTLNITLSLAAYELRNVVVKAGGEDPAYAIIRKAIRKRKTYLHEVKTYTCEAYVKGLQKLLAAPKKFMGRDINQLGKQLGLDSNRRGIIYLSESESKISFMEPDRTHEEVISSKVSGSNRAFTFNRAAEMTVNFYQNLQNWQGLSNRPLVSPIADNALSFYHYKWIGQTTENGQIINKIQVIPKHLYEPTFSGYIYIMEDSWRIHSVDLSLTKSAGINFVDTLKIKEQYIPVAHNAWLPASAKFEFTAGLFGFKLGGYFIALYKNYEVDPKLDKKQFAELVRITREVNKQDTTYWQQVRPIPLTEEEKTDYVKKETLARRRESKAYQDSIDRIFNKVTPMGLLVSGIGIRNRYKNEYYYIDPLASSLLYNTVEGFAINYGMSYSKRIDSITNKYVRLGGHIRYGFSNHMLHGNINGAFPVNDYTIAFSGGTDVVDMNNMQPITTLTNTTSSLFFRKNYEKLYDKHFAQVSVSRRIIGGWLASVSAEAADRRWLNNTSYYSFYYHDRRYTSNNPFAPTQEDVQIFDRNQAFTINVRTSYNFSNKYVTYPTGRYYLPSPYPRLEVNYTKGIKNVFGSDVDYDLLSANVSKENVSLGLYGNLSFYVGAGKFLNKNKLYYLDYKHFLGNQIILYKQSLNNFLLLNYYNYSTDNQYLEGHLEQNFDGLLLSKVPVLRRLKLQELVEYNYLTTPTFKNYHEIGLGIKYLNFRILYAHAYQDNNNKRSALRIDIGF